MKYSPTERAPWLASESGDWNRRSVPVARKWLHGLVVLALSFALAQAGAIPLQSSGGSQAVATESLRSTSSNPDANFAPSPTFQAPPLSLRGTQPIPFQSGPFFAENRVAPDDVKLPPMPSVLYPVPPAERKPTPVVLPPPSLATQSPADKARATVAAIKDSKGQNGANTGDKSPSLTAVAGTVDTPEQNIAVSPFIQWINSSPDAADIAKRAQKDYSANGVAENSIGSTDLFYNIRFPYVANESNPPGASAVIYSTPKK